jgi:hypothetical protein
MTNKQINITIEEIIRPALHGNIYRPSRDYCNDLNAMHEAEKMLVGRNNWELCDYVQRLNTATTSWIAFATAKQRAEEFLKTLGKWEE